MNEARYFCDEDLFSCAQIIFSEHKSEVKIDNGYLWPADVLRRRDQDSQKLVFIQKPKAIINGVEYFEVVVKDGDSWNLFAITKEPVLPIAENHSEEVSRIFKWFEEMQNA